MLPAIIKGVRIHVASVFSVMIVLVVGLPASSWKLSLLTDIYFHCNALAGSCVFHNLILVQKLWWDLVGDLRIYRLVSPP